MREHVVPLVRMRHTLQNRDVLLPELSQQAHRLLLLRNVRPSLLHYPLYLPQVLLLHLLHAVSILKYPLDQVHLEQVVPVPRDQRKPL